MKDDVNHNEHRGKGKLINLTYVMHLYKTSQVNPNLKMENNMESGSSKLPPTLKELVAVLRPFQLVYHSS